MKRGILEGEGYIGALRFLPLVEMTEKICFLLYSHINNEVLLNLKNAVEHIKTPFALSQSKGGRGFDMLTKWVGVWKPLMVRQAHHLCPVGTNGSHTPQLIFLG